MLAISERDIQQAVTLEEMLDCVEGALRLYQSGDFCMPLRSHLDHGPDTLLLMPCFTNELVGTKLVTLYPQNTQKGLPVINAVMIVNKADTGEPLAILNGRVLTAMRTGAVGGVGVRSLSGEKKHNLGLVGAGVQGYWQARFAAATGRINKVFIYDRLPQQAESLCARLAQDVDGIELHQTASVEELLESSRTIITATTSNEPVLPDDKELLAGRHFVGIGSYKPSMREFPHSLFELLDFIFVDTEHALQESGDVIYPLEQGLMNADRVRTLGSYLVSGNREPSPGETTLFKSVGMALFDVTVSGLILQKARQKGLGQEVEL